VTFLALVAALLLEQLRALSPGNPVHVQFRRFVQLIERGFDAGDYRHGIAAWALCVLPVVIVAAAIAGWLHRAAPFLGLAFDVAVLYVTMGFRQFSHGYGATHAALRSADVEHARAALERWYGASAAALTPSEIARVAIERGLICAHRHVFGVIAWFAVFGAWGAVLYRVAALLCDDWGSRPESSAGQFGLFSREAFAWIDWIPARLTAISFAVTGDFEDALYCWRTQAAAWPERASGIVLAAGAGAIGVRLGSVLGTTAPVQVRPELGTGDEADAELMTSATGLIWRALVLWLFVILLLTVATWFGSAGV
jgi:cobalamin biosynthesis protein CobD/CbiB